MLEKIYSLGVNFPKTVIAIVAALTAFFAMQLDGLRWETDARVYLPKGHEAIIYDEKVDDIFGVKDTLIVSIVNEKEGIYNPETLARIARLTKKVTQLPGVLATRDVDIASIASSTVFEGDEQRFGSRPIMDEVPQTPEQIAALKKTIEDHKDILVGNLVSADGTAAMIRIKIKEGQQHRYMTYFQVKNLISKELGEEPDWGPWGAGNTDSDGKWGGNEWTNADGTPKKKSSSGTDEPWAGNQWVNSDGSPKNQTKVEETTKKPDSDFAGNKWVKTDGTPKPAAAQAQKEEADWQGNQWINADGSAKKDPNQPDKDFAGNKWVKTDGTPKPSAAQTQKEETDWQGNQWVNADGSAKKNPNQPDKDFAGNKWVKTDGTPKPAAAQTQKEEADWQGNQWVNADGSAKKDPNQPDKDFAGNKWVKTDGTPKPAAAQTQKEEADWQGNQWVNADGSAKKDPNQPDKDFAGNKWVKTDGTPKPAAAQTQKEESDWQGNQWVNADGSAKTDPVKSNANFVGNKWVNADGSPKESAKQKVKEESDWAGNKWLNLDGTQRKALLANALPEGEEWMASDFEVSESKAKKVLLSSNIPNADPSKPINDTFFLAGRPVIEVSSGLYAMADMEKMVPLLIAVMAIVLLIIFRTWRGMLLPILVMSSAIIWTFGLMVVTNVPLYTISTMLPVILVAVGIGDGVHLMSAYYDKVLHNPQEDSYKIVKETTSQLGPPLIMTSITTAIGFLALFFAEMPPFKIFGVFALIGILFSWVISITLLPAILSLLKPKVGNYLAKRRAIRVYDEKNRLALFLTQSGRWIESHRTPSVIILAVLVIVSVIGTSRLYVDSSWMSDFREETDITKATNVLNSKFSGSIFLNVVIEAKEKDAFKNPALLNKMQGLQEYVETLPHVGDSISVVDYIKSMNKTLHAGDETFNVIPESAKQVGEYLFLFSVSGRPEQLDSVVDFDYQTGLVTVIIQTDHTKDLKHIMDSVNSYVDKEFTDLDVDVNLSGSGNNSFVWAQLLIDSQTTAIVISKIAILIVATIVFASLIAGFYVVIPVTLSTLFVAGVAGLLSIPLDVSTALAAGIAIGVGVDYAIHYLFRYIRERKLGQDHEQATAMTLRTTGHTIVLNATVVTVGFSVLFFSQFPPHMKLGIFVTAYMIMSCLVAVWVLPALISYFKPTFAEPGKHES